MAVHKDIVPTTFDELMAYRAYIAGGCRNCGVPEQDVDDTVQDILLHCMTTNFFARVQEKVGEGQMTPSRFRSYLGRTISNCLVNRYNKRSRDPAIGAMSLAYPTDSDDNTGSIDLDRLQSDLEPDDLSIPADVVEDDLIRFIADRKPHFLPTFILRMQGYRPADISRIIGKRKETIHYRLRTLQALVTEYIDPEKKQTKPTSVVGPLYSVKGENPFNRGACWHMWEAMKAQSRAMTTKEIARLAGDLIAKGRFTSTREPQGVAGNFIAYALEKDGIEEDAAPSTADDGGGRATCGPRVRYTLSAENPYKRWGSGHFLYESLKDKPVFSHQDVTDAAAELIKDGKIETMRSPKDVAWGFIETARNYQVLNRSEDVVESDQRVTGVTVNKTTKPAKKGSIPDYPHDSSFTLQVQGGCPFNKGNMKVVWGYLSEMSSFTKDDIYKLVERLHGKEIKSSRPTQQIGYSVWYHYHLKGLIVPTGDKTGQYRLKGDNPYSHGINYEIWAWLQNQGPFTREDIEAGIQRLLASARISSRRSSDELAYNFWRKVQKGDTLVTA